MMCMQGSASIPKGKIDKHFQEGVLFVTYSLLVTAAKAMAQDVDNTQTGGVDHWLPPGSRLAQIVEWLKKEEAPLIVLDECHKAKNLVTSGGATPCHGRCSLPRLSSGPTCCGSYLAPAAGQGRQRGGVLVSAERRQKRREGRRRESSKASIPTEQQAGERLLEMLMSIGKR